MKRKFPYVVMVAGPVGSGKSTGAHLAARILTMERIPSAAISSGWIYRLFAYLSIVLEVDWEANGSQDLVEEMTSVHAEISPEGELMVDGHPLAIEHLKTEDVSVLTSKIAQVPAVRQLAEAKLNEIIASFPGDVVLVDGRDFDRSIFGNNPVLGLVYMDVSDEKAAERSKESIEEVRARNARDAERLRLAREGADVSFGTDAQSLQESAETLASAVYQLLGGPPRQSTSSLP